jgi:hypothetical protein
MDLHVIELCMCRLRPPDDDKIYAVLEEGGLGGSDWNQWTRQAVSQLHMNPCRHVQYSTHLTFSHLAVTASL